MRAALPVLALLWIAGGFPGRAFAQPDTDGGSLVRLEGGGFVDEDTVQLRAKRAGNTVRTYTITVEATDESGNTATDTVEVTVPRSRGKKK